MNRQLPRCSGDRLARGHCHFEHTIVKLRGGVIRVRAFGQRKEARHRDDEEQRGEQGKEEVITGEIPYAYDLFRLFQENGWLNVRRGVSSIREKPQRRAMSA